MSNLVAVAYPDLATAKEVMGTLGRLQTEHAIELEDAVIVTCEDDVMVNVITQVAFFPSLPLLSLTVIGLDVVVLFALTARWEEAQGSY